MHKTDLAGTWSLVRERTGERWPADVPGDNMAALLASGAIPDPYSEKNELLVQWIGREDWRFERELEIDSSLLDDAALRDGMFLHFDSIDTIAEVRVNDAEVGHSNNMFLRHRFAIGEAVRAGKNLVNVRIRSPERVAEEKSERLPYPLPYSEYPVQSPHRNLLRKVQCHAGWDWGPCLMVSGIYGEVFVGAPRGGRLEYVTTRQRRRDGTHWEIDVRAEVFARRSSATSLRVALSGPGTARLERNVQIELRQGTNEIEATLAVDNPELWWPAGYGGQPLYKLSVAVDDDEVVKRIGFRELETVVENDERGRSMLFRVNGRDLFCKGANWIPMDALPARHTVDRYRMLLRSAREANMNMVRVWGGGQYESDSFYDICDELGLLVWQDFMFACSTYPADRASLEVVAEEVSHQVKRLQTHPSLALWCGNNENLGALTWFPETRQSRDRYLVDYDRLYEGTIGNLVETLDPCRTYWPSSPSGGRGDYSDNWHDDTKGDMHYWSVWHEGKPFDSYYEVTPRFCSEFGFQSFPSLSTVKSYAPADQLNLTSPVMEHHQRNQRGNTIIIESLSRYFRFPEGLENLLYLSQVQQAYAIGTAVEYWRSQRPVSAGALYWQLNDNWPVASWSSIEHSGKWKLLHYAAARFFAPLLVVGFVKDGALEVWLCNDTGDARGGVCTVRFLDFAGEVVHKERIDTRAAADSSTLVRRYSVDSLPRGRDRLFVTLLFESDDERASNDIFLTYPKHCDIRRAKVAVETGVEQGSILVTLNSDAPAFYVSLDAGALPGRFDDNCVTLLPGKSRQLRFLPTGPSYGYVDAVSDEMLEGFSRELVVRHLASSYR